jgi:diadenosine tetraphosphate (Ap4A) HIT family hydrolase
LNETILRFGYPASLVHESTSWCVLLRPEQVTAGCMILACKEDARSLGRISTEAGAELPTIAAGIEESLGATFRPQKINYLALMMVDPHVHFHVIPRYADAVRVGDVDMPDLGWPKHPDLGHPIDLPVELRDRIRLSLRGAWPSQSG